MNKFAWIIFSLITVSAFCFMIFIANQSNIDVSSTNINIAQVGIKSNGNIADHIYGNKNSKVILIEYADFQCPGCGEVYPIIKAAVDKYKDQVQFIFRNFPLTTIHANAKLAATSAEAAGLQGKFWEMHDKIYGAQDDWSSLTGDDRVNYFVSLAKDLGLDTTKFNNDLSSDKISQKIAYDIAMADKAKVDQTPTLFLNGKMLDSSSLSDVSTLEKVLQAAIK